MRNRSMLAVGAAAILLIACGSTKSPQSRPETRDTDPAPAATTAAAPAKTGSKAKAGTLSVRSTAQTRQRVSCAGIQTEVKLTANGGPVEWTSRAVDKVTSTGAVSSVTVSPASGSLATGASVIAKIGGSYPADKQKFWVLFEFPTSTGPASVNVDVSC